MSIQTTRYTQDGTTYICAGDYSTSAKNAREAAELRLLPGERLAEDMERIDGCPTWSVASIEYRTNAHGPHLADTAGGVWWPTEEAREIIEASEDPEATAIRLMQTDSNAGRWVD